MRIAPGLPSVVGSMTSPDSLSALIIVRPWMNANVRSARQVARGLSFTHVGERPSCRRPHVACRHAILEALSDHPSKRRCAGSVRFAVASRRDTSKTNFSAAQSCFRSRLFRPGRSGNSAIAPGRCVDRHHALTLAGATVTAVPPILACHAAETCVCTANLHNIVHHSG